MFVKYVSFPTKRAYGIELELLKTVTQAKIAKAIQEVDKNHDANVTSWIESINNSGWHVKTDSTCGWEIASYKGRGVGDLLNFARVADQVASIGGSVNERCGFHIHVEVKDFNDAQVAAVVAYWMKIEKVIQQMVPEHRAVNDYCKPLNEYFRTYSNREWGFSASSFWDAICPRTFGNPQRRVALNICNYAKAWLGDNWDAPRWTVELRLPEGTLEGNEVKNWIRFFIQFVRNCKHLPFPKDTRFVGVAEALNIIGLHGDKDSFLVLSPGMRDTKEWLLYRLLKYSRDRKYCTEAISVLNQMWSPMKVYELLPNCEMFVEAI